MNRADHSSRVRSALPYIAVFLLAMSVGCLHMLRYRTVSPIDELRHLDYAVKISNGQLTHIGDKIGEIAMREESCRGIDLVGWLAHRATRRNSTHSVTGTTGGRQPLHTPQLTTWGPVWSGEHYGPSASPLRISREHDSLVHSSRHLA